MVQSSRVESLNPHLSGELVKKLARSQLMGDVETFVSCFDPEEGRMVTILDRQGKPMLRKEGQESGEAEHKVVVSLSLSFLSFLIFRFQSNLNIVFLVKFRAVQRQIRTPRVRPCPSRTIRLFPRNLAHRHPPGQDRRMPRNVAYGFDHGALSARWVSFFSFWRKRRECSDGKGDLTGLAGVVKVKQNATTGLLEEVEFLAA